MRATSNESMLRKNVRASGPRPSYQLSGQASILGAQPIGNIGQMSQTEGSRAAAGQQNGLMLRPYIWARACWPSAEAVPPKPLRSIIVRLTCPSSRTMIGRVTRVRDFAARSSVWPSYVCSQERVSCVFTGAGVIIMWHAW